MTINQTPLVWHTKEFLEYDLLACHLVTSPLHVANLKQTEISITDQVAGVISNSWSVTNETIKHLQLK